MIGAPVPGVVNALQVTIPGRSPSVPSEKALGNARDEKKPITSQFSNFKNAIHTFRFAIPVNFYVNDFL